MDVTVLCIRLLINVLMVLVAQVHSSYCAQNDDAAFPCIVPNRLQFFEYESISVTCATEQRVMRTLKEINQTNKSNWSTSAGSGTVKPAYPLDSGEYWCEDGEGLRHSAVNISVTAGSVILESPVLPVKEGDNVTLRCTKKKSTSDIADFYKDGHLIRTGYKGNLIIHNVSRSHEGLYKCNITGAESPESRLAVRGEM
ncbi:low affinity immunoglobulin gamma Fc region receptor III-like [Thunnus albacares]|uniref:low affinity immunoglobulin gamma Fc region receptor III-like n=1 Tax=Thunnus albacares TaxID=8236 RepID=UPI001CF6AD8C|nr:low affinity immunoglobulin gamma Fc region receptor III-like [Thunnus albacares]